jgi:hypothetical protein
MPATCCREAALKQLFALHYFRVTGSTIRLTGKACAVMPTETRQAELPDEGVVRCFINHTVTARRRVQVEMYGYAASGDVAPYA